MFLYVVVENVVGNVPGNGGQNMCEYAQQWLSCQLFDSITNFHPFLSIIQFHSINNFYLYRIDIYSIMFIRILHVFLSWKYI